MTANPKDFSPNQTYEVGMFEINMNALRKLEQLVSGVGNTNDDDEDDTHELESASQKTRDGQAPWSRWSSERQRHVIRIQARGNYQQKNHRVELQYVVISETDTIKEGSKKTAKGEEIKSIHHLSEKADLTDAEARTIAEGYRDVISSPRQIEKLLPRLEIPQQVLQAFQIQRYPYTHVATALVEWQGRVLLQNAYGQDGEKQMVLPTIEEEKTFVGLERNLSALFARKGLRIEDVKLLRPVFDNEARMIIYGATANPTGDGLAKAFDKAHFCAVDKGAVQTHSQVTEETKRLLRWIDQQSKQTNG